VPLSWPPAFGLCLSYTTALPVPYADPHPPAVVLPGLSPSPMPDSLGWGCQKRYELKYEIFFCDRKGE